MRDSTGVVTARIIAEKDNPRADVIWGLGASSIALFDSMGMLERYTPAGADTLKPAFRDSKSPMAWTGMDAWLAVVCFNTAEGGKSKMNVPASWADLTKPEYKGQIVMPNPASSGTGYLAIWGWMQIMGEAGAWSFMDKLHDNVAVYTHSGSAPCVQSARGERVIGIGFDMRGARKRPRVRLSKSSCRKRARVGTWKRPRSSRAPKKLDAAKKLVDFTVSKGANELYNKYYAIVAHPGVTNVPPNYPPAAEPGDGEGRSREDGRRARPHPRRMDQALRRQVGAEVIGR